MDDGKLPVFTQISHANPERRITAAVFRPGQSVYRQSVQSTAQSQRAPTVVPTAIRTPGSAQNSWIISPTRKISMTTGRPAAVTPINIRAAGAPAVGGSAPAVVRTISGSTPGNIGIKRPLEYDFSMNMKKFHHRSADKSKGLRHFSTKVCEKVKEKGRTNYNEVADELVQEYFESMVAPGELSKIHDKQQYDMKNIRRRVYDALNVLMAMNIIEKEKKEIRWVGLPTSSIQECKRLEQEKKKRTERIREKAEQLQELVVQLVAYKSLVERNREQERNEGRPPQNTLLYLPYIVIHTDKKTMIDCSISHDKTEYLFNFDQPFEVHDDMEVLKRLGLTHGLDVGQIAPENVEKVKSYLPEAMRGYVDKILDRTLGGSAAKEPDSPPPGPAPRPPRGTRTGYFDVSESIGQETRIPLVTSRTVKQPQYITLPPAAHFDDTSAPDYGSKAYHAQFARRPASVTRDTTGSVRYVMPRGPMESVGHHSYSYTSPAPNIQPPANRRPTYQVVGAQGHVAASSPGISAVGYAAGAVGYGGYGTGSGDSDYSDMDSLGSNSNQGF